MDYKNGRIYKIVSDLTDKIYIGSTCQSLCKRLAKHKGDYRASLNGGNKYMTSFELFKLGETRIELIEDFQCERKEQLNAREGYHIKLNNDICVNRIIPCRTRQEYKVENKDKIKEQKKQYYKANTDKINEKQRLYDKANKDKINEKQKLYNKANKDKINEKQKLYNKANKAKISEYEKQYYAENKDKISEHKKQYYADNKDKINEKRRQNRQLNKIESQINQL